VQRPTKAQQVIIVVVFSFQILEIVIRVFI
jgi:hypothetical protein